MTRRAISPRLATSTSPRPVSATDQRLNITYAYVYTRHCTTAAGHCRPRVAYQPLQRLRGAAADQTWRRFRHFPLETKRYCTHSPSLCTTAPVLLSGVYAMSALKQSLQPFGSYRRVSYDSTRASKAVLPKQSLMARDKRHSEPPPSESPLAHGTKFAKKPDKIEAHMPQLNRKG
jgi:hypothetical protein